MDDYANVEIEVIKTAQSPTTPVVHLSYTVTIKSESFGVEGVFDSDNKDIHEIIKLLEKYNYERIQSK